MARIAFTLNGRAVEVDAGAESLLDVLRGPCGVRSAKDGCAPQGQCGCCTVLVDGQPRVACVTPAARVAGRAVTTLEGLPPDRSQQWAQAFCDTGASQCGFCTPGIVMRLDALDAKAPAAAPSGVHQALAAHLCRCTGWQTVTEAWAAFHDPARPRPQRDLGAATRRATLEGGAPQRVDPAVPLGRGGFAEDTAPEGALVAIPAGDGWVVAETLAEARALAGKVQGRRTTAALRWPLEVPGGTWARTLRTTWVEPAYLEPDATWCEPGGVPVSLLANGGAFGAKAPGVTGTLGDLGAVARRLADEHGRPVRVLLPREEVVRRGPKRPPVAVGVDPDGSGVLRVARTPGIAAAIGAVAPGLTVEEVDVAGPATSSALRGAGWAEAAVALAAAAGRTRIDAPNGAWAEAAIGPDGAIAVTVWAGDPLDDVTLRSYCIGAAHMALGWVTSEGIAVDDDGDPQDLTIRSFGILKAADMPRVEVIIDATPGEPRNGSDAAFAAVATAVWAAQGWAQDWPTSRRRR